jgi:hypothetical protein
MRVEVHVVLRQRFSKKVLPVVAALGLGLSLGWTLAAQDAKPAKNWKDRAEYDMADAANKAAAKDRVALIEKWKTAYPATEYADERMDLYLMTYRELNDCRKAFDTSLEILKTRPNNEFSTAIVLGCLYTFNPPSAADMDAAERVATAALANLDAIYADSNKPGIGFVQTKDQTKSIANRTLGYVPFTKKDYPKAEVALKKGIEADNTQATLSNWLATSLVQQNKQDPSKYPLGLFHFARAAAYDGPNSLPAANRKQIQDYVAKAYTAYHGSAEGFDQLLASAKANAFPPAGFEIKSTVDLAKDKAAAEEKEKEAMGPMKVLWVKILREPLTAANGASYFDMTVKEAGLPGGANGVTKFKGKIVSMTPATRPKEIVLAIENDGTGDATLKFDEPLPGKMEVGEELAFSGTAKAYTASPFMMTFEVEPTDLEGWTGKGPAAPAKPKAPAGAKPAAPKPAAGAGAAKGKAK